MKTHEFAKHLDRLADLLRQLPDAELDTDTAQAIQALMPASVGTVAISNRTARALPDDIDKRLEDMPTVEIERFLLSSEEGFTVANLAELAGKLGLTTSKRQSRNALVNLIVRYYEAQRMHSLIRSTRPDEANN